MLYLLDANVLITANNLYYPVKAVPEFWAWLAHQGTTNDLKMPIETFEEVKDGGKNIEKDLLFAWVNANKAAILLDEEASAELVRRVVEEGYAPDLTDDEVEQIGRDPFLIAYALASPGDRCIVTTEVSSPRKQRQNRRIPDVCAGLGITCCDTFAMLRALDFSTNWRKQN
ncbi:MAG: DUF4411 family protein [Gammaproteobacteria bacterium]|nr:DUF4411 family protein [Gammaproteobacteria bacterium]